MKNTVEIENRATLVIKALEKAKSYREYREKWHEHRTESDRGIGKVYLA